MYRLYLDTSNSILTILITKDMKTLNSYCKNAYQKQTEFAIKIVFQMLSDLDLTIEKITDLIITIGPGSYTGVRVAITFAKVIKFLNKNINIYTLNSLLLQAGSQKAVSIIEGYNNKSYLAAYEQGNEIISPQLVSNNAKVGIINDLKEYHVIENFKGIDLVKNFLELNNNLKIVNHIDDLKPIYIGGQF